MTPTQIPLPSQVSPTSIPLPNEENRMSLGTMEVMGPEGDTKVVWDSNNASDTEAARDLFNTLKKKGYLAYSVEKGGSKGSVVRDFDPSAEKLILAPAVAGG